MNKGLKRGLMALPLLLLPLFPAAAPAADPARELVMEIGEAVNQSDAEGFASLVDLDAILGAALDAFVKEASKPENASLMPPMIAMILPSLAGQASSPARELLLSEAKSFALSGISSGAFAGRKPDLSRSSGLMAPLFAQASLGRKEIKNIGQPEAAGGGWIVPFVIYDHDNGNEYPVKGRVERSGGGLKLTGVENLPQLIQLIGAEAGASQ